MSDPGPVGIKSGTPLLFALFCSVTRFETVFLVEALGSQRRLSQSGLPEKQALSKGSSVSNSFGGVIPRNIGREWGGESRQGGP